MEIKDSATANMNKTDTKGRSGNAMGSVDMESITDAINMIEKDMRKVMVELVALKGQVARSSGGERKSRKNLGKVNRIVGWLKRRPGANAKDAGFLVGDVVKIINIVQYKKTRKKIREKDVIGVVKDITKRFVVVLCKNPDGVLEDVDREPHHVRLVERDEEDGDV